MSDLLEIQTEAILHQTVQEVVLLEPAGSDDMLEVPAEHVLLQPSENNTLLEPVETLVLLTEAQQGPPGPQGAPGQSGVNYAAFLADGPIGGHRAVCAAFDGRVRYADSGAISAASAVLGVTLHAADDGAPVNVVSSGEVTEPSWAWIEHAPIFVGVAGGLTQTPPTAGFHLVVGVATSATSMLVGIKQPIIL